MTDPVRPSRTIGRVPLAIGTIVLVVGVAILAGAIFGPGGDREGQDGKYSAEVDELLGWDNICDTLLAAGLGRVMGLESEPEVINQSAPSEYSNASSVDCMLKYDALDCRTGEPATDGASFIDIAAYPKPDGEQAKAQYELLLEEYGGQSATYRTHFESLSKPWTAGEVFVSPDLLDAGTRSAAAVAVADFYAVELSVELKGEGCEPTMEEVATLLAEEFMPLLHDSIESRLA
ncbi:MAG: hypothetical protein HOQ24_09745 [Mycobacteriaceae bacterium]|nr:hypothetical protein [Mycobacteriaceae bacterium]